MQKFIPRINGPKNGIIRYLYPNDRSTFSVSSSLFHPALPGLYSTAMLNVSSDYSQMYSGEYQTIWVDVIFKKLIYLTHVSYTARVVNNSSWKYPTDFSILGTTETKQTISIFRNNNPSYLNKTEPVVMPVRPGIYQSIRLEQLDSRVDFFVVQYLDLFGAICDPISICYGNPFDIICTLPVNYYIASFFSIFSSFILVLS